MPTGWRGGVWGGNVPLPTRLGVWGSVVSSRKGVRAEPGRKRVLVHFEAKKPQQKRHHFKARPTVFDSKTDRPTPKDMVGVPLFKTATLA